MITAPVVKELKTLKYFWKLAMHDTPKIDMNVVFYQTAQF